MTSTRAGLGTPEFITPADKFTAAAPDQARIHHTHEKRNLALADKYWAEEVSGSNSFIQRSKRLMFKVPHYKTGAELAKMVAEAKGKK